MKLNADAIEAALARDRADRAPGQPQCLALTQTLIGEFAPDQWASVATTVHALLRREPFRSSPVYQAERIILGGLSADLMTLARDAGEPEPELSDEELDEWDQHHRRTLAAEARYRGMR